MCLMLKNMENVKEENTKIYQFGITWRSYGPQSIRVPKNFTEEQTQEYIKEHWDEITIPQGNADDFYLIESDKPDFRYAKFSQPSNA